MERCIHMNLGILIIAIVGGAAGHSFHTFFDGEFPGRHYLENLPQNTLLPFP